MVFTSMEVEKVAVGDLVLIEMSYYNSFKYRPCIVLEVGDVYSKVSPLAKSVSLGHEGHTPVFNDNLNKDDMSWSKADIVDVLTETACRKYIGKADMGVETVRRIAAQNLANAFKLYTPVNRTNQLHNLYKQRHDKVRRTSSTKAVSNKSKDSVRDKDKRNQIGYK